MNRLAIRCRFIFNIKCLDIVAVRAVHGIAVGRQAMHADRICSVPVVDHSDSGICNFLTILTIINADQFFDSICSRSYPFCIAGILPADGGIQCVFLRIDKVLTIIFLAVTSRNLILVDTVGNLLGRIGSIRILNGQIFRKPRIAERIDALVAVCG